MAIVPTTVWHCPNNDPDLPTSLEAVLKRLEDDSEFATFFAGKLKMALAGDHGAIDCVDSYLKPTWEELTILGIDALDQSVMRHCTDSGFLVLSECKKRAPGVFQ